MTVILDFLFVKHKQNVFMKNQPITMVTDDKIYNFGWDCKIEQVIYVVSTTFCLDYETEAAEIIFFHPEA